jgi:hypothetical protein
MSPEAAETTESKSKLDRIRDRMESFRADCAGFTMMQAKRELPVWYRDAQELVHAADEVTYRFDGKVDDDYLGDMAEFLEIDLAGVLPETTDRLDSAK